MTDHFELSIMIGTREISGFRSNKIEESHHGLFRIQHRFVHIDVDNLRPTINLMLGNGQGFLKIFIENELRELRASR